MLESEFPPLWSLFVPRCPYCGSTTFRLISTVDVYDTLYFDEDGAIMELEDASDVFERADPLHCDEVECAECDKPMPEDVVKMIRKLDWSDVLVTW